MRPLSVSILKGRKGLTFSQSIKIWRVIDLAQNTAAGNGSNSVVSPLRLLAVGPQGLERVRNIVGASPRAHTFAANPGNLLDI